MTHIITTLSRRYPQLLLPIGKGIRDSEEYQNAVLRGKPITGMPEFSYSPLDRLSLEQTPAGAVEVLYLADRNDFEHALRALAYRCEAVAILPSVGASTVGGLINWEKIRSHQQEYLAGGGKNWSEEFRRFTAERRNYQDTLILLSGGEYSAVSAEELNLEGEAWRAKSLCIRKYHELSHFVCRMLFPEDIDTIRDEILADLIGIVAAFQHYDPALARRFLGIQTDGVRADGRLRHYVEEHELAAACEEAERRINEYEKRTKNHAGLDVFSLLIRLMRVQSADD